MQETDFVTITIDLENTSDRLGYVAPLIVLSLYTWPIPMRN